MEEKITLINKIKTKFKIGHISVSRIAILGMLLALMITLKYALGFIPGIEVISFMFIFLGIFLPIVDLCLLVASFNLLIMIVYGFGSWWIMYWIIWPVDTFVSKLISRLTKNKFVFGAWGFIVGFSVLFWYFLSDLIFFDSSYAALNIISALPINLVEGMTTMIACITIAPSMARVFNHYSLTFWNNEKSWEFKKIKNIKINIAVTSLIVIVFVTSIALLFVYNDFFLHLKQSLVTNKGDRGHI